MRRARPARCPTILSVPLLDVTQALCRPHTRPALPYTPSGVDTSSSSFAHIAARIVLLWRPIPLPGWSSPERTSAQPDTLEGSPSDFPLRRRGACRHATSRPGRDATGPPAQAPAADQSRHVRCRTQNALGDHASHPRPVRPRPITLNLSPATSHDQPITIGRQDLKNH